MQHSQQDMCLNPPSFLGMLPVQDSDSLKAVDEAPSPVWGMGRYWAGAKMTWPVGTVAASVAKSRWGRELLYQRDSSCKSRPLFQTVCVSGITWDFLQFLLMMWGKITSLTSVLRFAWEMYPVECLRWVTCFCEWDFWYCSFKLRTTIVKTSAGVSWFLKGEL